MLTIGRNTGKMMTQSLLQRDLALLQHLDAIGSKTTQKMPTDQRLRAKLGMSMSEIRDAFDLSTAFDVAATQHRGQKTLGALLEIQQRRYQSLAKSLFTKPTKRLVSSQVNKKTRSPFQNISNKSVSTTPLLPPRTLKKPGTVTRLPAMETLTPTLMPRQRMGTNDCYIVSGLQNFPASLLKDIQVERIASQGAMIRRPGNPRLTPPVYVSNDEFKEFGTLANVPDKMNWIVAAYKKYRGPLTTQIPVGNNMSSAGSFLDWLSVPGHELITLNGNRGQLTKPVYYWGQADLGETQAVNPTELFKDLLEQAIHTSKNTPRQAWTTLTAVRSGRSGQTTVGQGAHYWTVDLQNSTRDRVHLKNTWTDDLMNSLGRNDQTPNYSVEDFLKKFNVEGAIFKPPTA